MDNQSNTAVLEKPDVQETPNPSGAPAILPGDEIIFSVSLDLPQKQWIPGLVTTVFPDQGTCHAVTFLKGGLRGRTAIHYWKDPRLKEFPDWLKQEDTGVWELSRKEQIVRKNQKTLERIEANMVRLDAKISELDKDCDSKIEDLQASTEKQIASIKKPQPGK